VSPNRISGGPIPRPGIFRKKCAEGEYRRVGACAEFITASSSIQVTGKSRALVRSMAFSPVSIFLNPYFKTWRVDELLALLAGWTPSQ
jgi:hypothetical protein